MEENETKYVIEEKEDLPFFDRLLSITNALELHWNANNKIFKYKVHFTVFDEQVDLMDHEAICAYFRKEGKSLDELGDYCVDWFTKNEMLRKLFDEFVEVSIDDFDLANTEFICFNEKNVFYTKNILKSVEEGPIKLECSEATRALLNIDTEVFANVQFVDKVHPDSNLGDFLDFIELVVWQNFLAVNKINKRIIFKNNTVHFLRTLKTKGILNNIEGLATEAEAVTQTKYLVALKPKNTLFYPVTSVYSFLAKMSKRMDSQLAKWIQENLKELSHNFKGLRLVHVTTGISCTVEGLTSDPVTTLVTSSEDSTDVIAVYDYYKETYGMRINMELPAFYSKDSNGLLRYFPLDGYQFEEYQEFRPSPLFKHEALQADPSLDMFLKYVSSNLIFQKGLLKPIGFLEKYGIFLVSNTKCVNAKRLLPPQLQFPNTEITVDIESGVRWVNSAHKLILHEKGYNENLRWALVIFDNCLDAKQISILKSSVFFGLRTDKLGTGSKPIEPTVFFYRNVSSDLYYDCQRVMDDVITASCTAVVYAGTAYKRLDSYMKFLECTKGVATYGLDPKHVTKNQHGQRKWRPQLRQSMNIKLGGINFQFQFPQLAEKVNFIKNNFVVSEYRKRMFFGVEITQISSQLSAFGVAYTLNNLLLTNGFYFFGKDQNDLCLEDKLNKAIQAFRKVSLAAPDDLFVYVDVKYAEVVKQTLENVKEKYQLPGINVICLSINGNSSFSFLNQPSPDNNKDTLANIPQGSLVLPEDFQLQKLYFFLKTLPCVKTDRTITSTDLYVITGDITPFPKIKDLAYLTFYLCAADPLERRVCRYPLPLNAAKKFCKRALENRTCLKELLKNNQITSELPNPFLTSTNPRHVITSLNTFLQPDLHTYFVS